MAVAGGENDERPDGPAAPPDDWQPADASPTAGAFPRLADPSRPGPDVLEADSWTEPEPPTSSPSTVYTGRHHTTSSRSKLRIAVGAGVAGLVAVVAIPLALSGSPSAQAPATTTAAVPGDPPPATSGDPGNAGVSTSPSPGVSASPSGTKSPAAAPTTRPTAAPPKTTAAVVPFTPLTVEAEAGGEAVTLGGSAWIAPYDRASNGRIARNVGDWDMRGGPGTVRFNGVNFPTSGTYVLAISYVHPDGESNRSAQVTVSGVTPVTVSFSGSSRCCDVKAVSLTVPAGTRTITISNSSDTAPSIDKIVITRS